MRASSKSRAKARKVSEARKDIRLSLLAERGPMCQAPGCHNPWTDMHEVLTRGRGGDPTDPENILCLCQKCHVWVTTHEDDARVLGLVRARTAEEHRALYRPWETP